MKNYFYLIAILVGCLILSCSILNDALSTQLSREFQKVGVK